MKLALLFLFIGAIGTDKPARDVRILGTDPADAHGRILSPHIAPVLFVHQVSGDELPTSGSVSCSWDSVMVGKRQAEIFGHCENGAVVQLTGIDLNY